MEPELDFERACQQVAESGDIDSMLKILRERTNLFRGHLVPNALALVSVGTPREVEVLAACRSILEEQPDILREIQEAIATIEYFSGKTEDIDWLLTQAWRYGIPTEHFPHGKPDNVLRYDTIMNGAEQLLRERHLSGPRGEEVNENFERLGYFDHP